MRLIESGSAEYEAVRRPAMARFHAVRPRAVALCATPADVAEAIAYARAAGLEVVPRSGGHCFEGRSSTDGVVIDVRPMRAVAVGDGVVTVGSGARLGEIYDALARHGLTVAAGCGPDVGVAGLALGGGLGILGRRYGLVCDQLVAAELVRADGRVLACDAEREPDLFWALRGAGGGRFGVVTRLTLRTVPAPEAITFHRRWDAAEAPGVIEAWQEWAPDAPDAVAASLLLTPTGVHLFGATTGAEPTGLARGAARTSGAYREIKAHLAAHHPGEEDPPPPDAHVFAKSEFFARPLPLDAIEALVAHHRAAPVPADLDFTPWGGAYGRVPAAATAFPHRDARFLLKHGVAVAPEQHAAARDWLRRSWEIVHPYGTGGAYVNFPDAGVPDAAYHLGNAGRVAAVKAAYDPENVFGAPRHAACLPGASAHQPSRRPRSASGGAASSLTGA